MTHKLVAVVWDDAHAIQSDTMTAEEIGASSACVMTTFGILAREDDRLVSVAAELHEDGSFRGVTFVPRSLVKEIVPLGSWPKKARKKKEKVDEGPVQV